MAIKSFRRGQTLFLEGILEHLERRLLQALSVLALRGISFILQEELASHGMDEMKALLARYGEGAQSYIDGPATLIERRLMKELVRSQHYPTTRLETLWKIIASHHEDMFSCQDCYCVSSAHS